MDVELDRLFRQAKPTVFNTAPPRLSIPAAARQSPALATAAPAAAVAATATLPEQPARAPREPESAERLARTLFVGNVPAVLVGERREQRVFRALFEAHGAVQSLRFRSIATENALPKRVAFITGKVHKERPSCNSYVVMADAESAQRAAAALNGHLFGGRHLRVDIAGGGDARLPTKKSVFLGNLPLNVSDESLWGMFEACGPVAYVRVIRDRETGLGKGFGYVAFRERAAVELALQLNGSDCEGRPIRIKKCAKAGYQQAKKAFADKQQQRKEREKQGEQKRESRTARQSGAPRNTKASQRTDTEDRAGKGAPRASRPKGQPETGPRRAPGASLPLRRAAPVAAQPKWEARRRDDPSDKDKHPAQLRMERKMKRSAGPSTASAGKAKAVPSKKPRIAAKATPRPAPRSTQKAARPKKAGSK